MLRVVDAMSESHHFLLLLEQPMDVSFDMSRRLNLKEHLHDLLVGATMQWTFQRADRGCDGRVHIGERRGYDASSERGRIVAVVRVQNQRHIKPARIISM